MAARRLGVYLPPDLTDIVRTIMRGIGRYFQEHGGWELATHEGLPWLPWDTLMERECDGIIASVFHVEQYEALRRLPIPRVNVCGRYETPGLASVYSDNLAVGQLAASVLWETRMPAFAFLGRAGFLHDRLRGEGFRAALLELGAECEVIEVKSLSDHPHELAEIQIIREHLKRMPRPVAVFAGHDNIGCEVLAVCRQLSIDVPYELAVLGVNDFTLVCELAEPPLSSIRQQAEQIGWEALRLLTDIVEGRADPETQLLLPPGPVVRRRSTDVTAVDDPDVLGALQFIRDRLEEPITSEDVAARVALSRRGLDKRFMATIGHTVAAELLKIRLRRATELLVQTELGVSQVGVRCGFGSTSSFHRAFHAATGMTPTQYRNTHTVVR